MMRLFYFRNRAPGIRVYACGFALAFAISCTTVDLVTGQKARNVFSIQDDMDFGNEAFQELMAEMKNERVPVNRDCKTTRRVRQIADRIIQASDCATNFAFEVAYFETNIVNAFAFPGGKIAIFEGLWDKEKGLVQDDDELAAVLAHEVAHVTCRHSTEEMTRHLPAELLLTAVAVYAEYKEDEDWAVAMDAAFLVYGGLIVPKYSRQDESEADRIGLVYMARAGYDPQAAVRLWKRVYEREGDEWPVLSIFSTHPSNRARYEALERLLPEVLAIYETHRTDESLVPADSGKIVKQETKVSPPGKAGLFGRSTGEEDVSD